MPFGNRKVYFRGSFCSLLSKFKKNHPSGNLKFNNSGIFQSLKFRIFMEKIPRIYLELKFTPNTSGGYGLSEVPCFPRLVKEGRTEDVGYALCNIKKEAPGSCKETHHLVSSGTSPAVHHRFLSSLSAPTHSPGSGGERGGDTCSSICPPHPQISALPGTFNFAPPSLNKTVQSILLVMSRLSRIIRHRAAYCRSYDRSTLLLFERLHFLSLTSTCP